MLLAIKIFTWLTLAVYGIVGLSFLVTGFTGAEMIIPALLSLLVVGVCAIIPILTLVKVKKCENQGSKDSSITVLGIFNILFGNLVAGILLLLTNDSHFNPHGSAASYYEEYDDPYNIKYCSNCGQKMTRNTKYCPNCGKEQ